MVKLRLQRKGRKKSPFYFIVAANASSPRDGKFIDKIGTYSPLTVPATIEINREKALIWLTNGAQPTNTVKRILSFKGILYWKHLQRGVTLGLFDNATAEQRYEQWVSQHDLSIKEKKDKHKKQKEQVKTDVWASSVSKLKTKQQEKQQKESEKPTEDASPVAGETPAGEE